MASHKKSVIIAGAGSVGLLIAILLGKQGVNTLGLERNSRLHKETRVLLFNPIVFGLLEEFGTAEIVLKEGYLSPADATWRDIQGQPIASLGLNNEERRNFGSVFLISQSNLREIFLEELQKYPSVEVLFNSICVEIEDSESSDRAKVMTWHNKLEENITYEADWIIGADGENSSVRSCLDMAFNGHTWSKERMITVHVDGYNFEKESNWGPITAIADPINWAVILQTRQDAEGKFCTSEKAVWRISYGEDASLESSSEARNTRALERLAKYTKEGSQYKVLSAETQELYQRCANEPRKGRVLLAGDALHVSLESDSRVCLTISRQIHQDAVSVSRLELSMLTASATLYAV